MKSQENKLNEFIAKAMEIYGNKYDYSKVNYINSKTKVCIICPEHGEFWVSPNQFLKGGGCKLCKRKIYNLQSFIEEAKKIHGEKYDYSKSQYIDNYIKVCIICPEHGEFWQTPYQHVNEKRGCHKCRGKFKKRYNKLTAETFIQLAKEIHDDKYDYSKVDYQGYNTDVAIVCPYHGAYYQKPRHHLSGHACPRCSPRAKLTTEEFINRAKQVHGDKYDYSKSEYVDNETKLCVICPIHGEFWVSPASFLVRKTGCPVCGHEETAKKIRLGLDVFIDKARKIHGDKYDYSKVNYINNSTKVCIVCPEHGEFWQSPNAHLRGQGCQKCNESSLEIKIRNLLTNKCIKFIPQQKFDWLKHKSKLSLDFYLLDYNVAIECQGKQHFGEGYFCANGEFAEIKERDALKFKQCQDHGIKVLYFSDKKYSDEIIIDETILLKELKNHA